MKHILYLFLIVLITIFVACQSPNMEKKQAEKIKTEQQKKSKSQPKKQSNSKKNKNTLAKKSTKRKKGKKRLKYPSMTEQKKVLGLTDTQVKDIKAANGATKKARGIIKKQNNGKITNEDNRKINNTKENRLKKSLGVELYNKRKAYIKNYQTK